MALREEDGWRRVALRADVRAGEPTATNHGDTAVLLVEYEGQLHALSNICPHAYALMSEGFFEDCQIECPLHAALFDVRTGKCLGGPTREDLAVYEVRVEGDGVWVRVPG